MKRLHLFILKNYAPPFVLTLVIAMAFLVMQFYWKWIDELVGKGLDTPIILELTFYVSASLIPLALPLAILLSSIMLFGNLAENNELPALKSSGISLYRILLPLILLMVALSVFAFFFSNNVLPVANLKWRTIIYDIRSKKPLIALTPGVFYRDLEGYSIRISDKDESTNEIYDVLIYDHKQPNALRRIHANKGELKKSQDDQYLYLKLYEGRVYEEMRKGVNKDNRYPYQRSRFDTATIRFQLVGFEFERSDDELFKKGYEMLTINQIEEELDNVQKQARIYMDRYVNGLKQRHGAFPQKQDSDTSAGAIAKRELALKSDSLSLTLSLDSLSEMSRMKALSAARKTVTDNREACRAAIKVMEGKEASALALKAQYHEKFTLSAACIILFFIGAPLGAIVRKGGVGAPFVMATLLFLVYYILSDIGKTMATSGLIDPRLGMWLSSMMLLPVGLVLTLRAANDKKILSMGGITKWFKF